MQLAHGYLTRMIPYTFAHLHSLLVVGVGVGIQCTQSSLGPGSATISLQFELVKHIWLVAFTASSKPAGGHFLLHVAIILLGLALFVLAHCVAAQV